MRISDWSSDVCSSDLRTNLAAVEECEGENGGSDGFNICIRQHDRGVIAAKLQRQALERGRDRSHDRAPRVGGTRERDFGDIGMTHQMRARFIAAGQDIDDARRDRSEEHTSELKSLMRISYSVFFLTKKNKSTPTPQ